MADENKNTVGAQDPPVQEPPKEPLVDKGPMTDQSENTAVPQDVPDSHEGDSHQDVIDVDNESRHQPEEHVRDIDDSLEQAMLNEMNNSEDTSDSEHERSVEEVVTNDRHSDHEVVQESTNSDDDLDQDVTTDDDDSDDDTKQEALSNVDEDGENTDEEMLSDLDDDDEDMLDDDDPDDEDDNDVSMEVIMETIEPGMEEEPRSDHLELAKSVGGELEHAEMQGDEAVKDPQDEPLHAVDVHDQEVQDIEPENDVYMQHDQNVSFGQDQPHGSTNFQQAYAEDEQHYDDPDSLFVSEHEPPDVSHAHQDFAVPTTFTSTAMPPPPRGPARSGPPALSVRSRIRDAQKRHAEKRSTASMGAAARQFNTDPELVMPSESSTPSVVDEEEVADRHARAVYKAKLKEYNDRKQNSTLSFRQEVEFMKLRNEEESRRVKRARDLEKDQEDMGDPFHGTPTAADEDTDEVMEDADTDRAKPSRKRSRQVTQERSMQDAEMRSMRVALDASQDAPKKKRKKDDSAEGRSPAARQGKPKGPKSKGKATKPKTNNKTKPKPKSTAKGGRKTAKEKRTLDNALKQTTSLFNANVFEQQAAEGEAEATYTGTSRNKATALQELIASLPIEDQQEAKDDGQAILAATKDFDGRGSVKVDGALWRVKGMRTALKGYQVLGTSFMRKREHASEKPRGGLLADQMGLGKTVMMLANIVNGRRPKGNHPRTTLIVASPALLTQWAAEINEHTNCGLSVLRHVSGNRLDSNNAMEILKSFDIVLTTYTEVMRSYPKNEPPLECITAEQKAEWWKKTYEEHRGILHQMNFERVVLDEAQAIKNHQGRTSIACRALIAEHKWALSGTPILNSLTELYAYFKFLEVPHTGSFKIFKNNYCDAGDPANVERLLLRLAQFMIRRTHSDRLFNAPILKLPQADQSTFWCHFNSVERCIYDVVRQRFAYRINIMSKNNQLENGRSYNNAMVMLLRLRQITAHVLMLQFVMKDLLEREDIERIKEIVNNQAQDSATKQGKTIIAIRKQLEQHAINEKKKAEAKAAAKAAGRPDEEGEANDDEVSGQQEEEMDESAEFLTGQLGAGNGGSGRSFGKEYNFKPYLKDLRSGTSWAAAKKKARCIQCHKQPRVPLCLTTCKHIICQGKCVETLWTEAAEMERTELACKQCGMISRICIPCEDEDDDVFTEHMAERTRSKRGLQKAKERPGREDIKDDWLNNLGEDVLPSAKTIAVKAQILNWRKENRDVKIIIYTQFLPMVRILSKICSREGWASEQYIGTMSFKAREKAITTFAKDPECNILLASLRCGGLGLNLTMASRVIMIDPWWNSAAEQQAFCRIFRIGQKDETYMSRLCVQNSVDEKLMDMQKYKEEEISKVMEDDGTRVKKLKIKDLMRLFGNLEEDSEGRPFIMVDNPDIRGSFMVDKDDEGYADDE